MSLPSSMADFVTCDRLLQKAHLFPKQFLKRKLMFISPLFLSEHAYVV